MSGVGKHITSRPMVAITLKHAGGRNDRHRQEEGMNDICKNCKRQKHRHKAKTLNCPSGRLSNFQQFRVDMFFEQKIKETK